MSWISAADPLALVAIQAGQVGTPATEAGAAGGGKLDTPQRAVELGEPVPIVFGRRRTIGGIAAGGVLISPGATEARFENDTSNNVTAYYHLVLSEGLIDSIPVKDVFQRSCRVGSHSQTYNRRAGTWAPGNAIVARAGYDMPECPYYCGSVGVYPGMSTLSFSVTIPNGFDQWNRQVHCFVRGGMHVTRLQDAVAGPSDSLADLAQWIWLNSSRVPAGLLDATALAAADDFLEANGFTCNCWITDSQNVGDLLAKWAPYFLLIESSEGGKKGLRPVLPVNTDGTLNTGAISWEYMFTEATIIPGSFEIQYTSLADRLPFVAQMTWRQQLEDDFGIIRTAEVRYDGTALEGPYESHDLSAFCTTENHAVKVGAYILSKRVNTTHTIRFTARPEAHNRILTPGDIVRVRLERNASNAAPTAHDYLYQVERVTKTLAGDISYECVHFPLDDQGRSLVALDVDAATGTGILLTSNKSGVGCDINSPTDNTVPAETFSLPDFSVIDAGATEILPFDQQLQEKPAGPKLSGVLDFLSVSTASTDDPYVFEVTIEATCYPAPVNVTDGTDADRWPPPPSDQLKITLSNGQEFYISPLLEGTTTTIGTLIYEDDITGESGPVTRNITVTGWEGGGFDELDTSEGVTYVLGAPSTPVIRVEARDSGGTAVLYTTDLPYDKGTGNNLPSLTLTGGPFGDPAMILSEAAYSQLNVYANANELNPGTSPFTFEVWVKIPAGITSYPDLFFMEGDAGFLIARLAVYESELYMLQCDANFNSEWCIAPMPAVGQWTHIAICRDTTEERFYVNGTQVAKETPDPGYTPGTNLLMNRIGLTAPFTVGKSFVYGQIVYTLGTAKYNADFTPPTARI